MILRLTFCIKPLLLINERRFSFHSTMIFLKIKWITHRVNYPTNLACCDIVNDALLAHIFQRSKRLLKLLKNSRSRILCASLYGSSSEMVQICPRSGLEETPDPPNCHAIAWIFVLGP